MYEPTSAKLLRVRSRVTEATWQKRVAKAARDEAVIQQILAEEKQGLSLNQAIARVVPPEQRSWGLRRIPAYREEGFEALIDERTPREPAVSVACRHVVQTAREMDARVSSREVLKLLHKQGIAPLPSESTIKREFARVDERRKYARKKARAQGAAEVIELPLAGGELLMAAEQETRGMAALTEMVLQLSEQAQQEGQGQEPEADVEDRDERGRFTARYNQQRRRKAGEQSASYLRPAADKGQGKVPTWPRFVHEGAQTLVAKVQMLTLGWMIAKSKGWDALRSPEAAGLEEVVGYAYMPSTLSSNRSGSSKVGSFRSLTSS